MSQSTSTLPKPSLDNDNNNNGAPPRKRVLKRGNANAGPSNYESRKVVWERRTSYGVPWQGRHPDDPAYDPYHDDPHHYDWCDRYTIIVIVFMLIFIGLFAAAWWTGPYYHTTSTSSLPMGDSGNDAQLQGSGGEEIPGLGLVRFQSKRARQRIDGQCPPGARYNVTMHMCEPRKQYPMAVEPALWKRPVHMCESFYKHTCGTWLDWYGDDAHALADYGGYADRSFSYLFHRNRWLLDRIVQFEQVGGTPIDTFYHSCINSLVKDKYQRNARQFRNDMLGKTANALHRLSDIPTVFARMMRHGFVTPITFAIEKHPTKPMMVPFWGHDNFPEHHVKQDAVQRLFETIYSPAIAQRKTRDFLAMYQTIETRRPSDAAIMGRDMHEYMAYLSGIHFERDMITMQTLDQLMHDQDIASTSNTRNGWSLDRFFHALEYAPFRKGKATFSTRHPVWVRDKTYYQWFFSSVGPLQEQQTTYGSEDRVMRQWKAYVEFSVLYGTHDFAPALEHNAYYHGQRRKARNINVETMWVNKYPAITHGLRALKRHRAPPGKTRSELGSARAATLGVDKTYCARITQEMLAGHVAKQFLRHTYAASKETHDRVLEVIERVRARFVQLIRDTWWFSERDRAATIEKLQAIIIRVAQPHHWEAESYGYAVRLNSYWNNLDMARQYRVQRNWDRWNAQEDRAHQLDRDALQRFGGALSTINAYYSPLSNTVTVFAGILQHPFYYPRYNNASLYAIVGSVVGHEISHALGTSFLFCF